VPKEYPNAVRVVHEKTHEQNWIPLFDDQTGAPFCPVLMAELDTIKKTRIAGLMLRRDWGKQDPWPTFPKEGEIDLTHMSRKVKEVIRAARSGRPTHLHVVPPWRVYGGRQRRPDRPGCDGPGAHKSPRCSASTSSGPCGRLPRVLEGW
jgi:hypothetical protein